MAGADIRELGILREPGRFTLRDLLPHLDACRKPLIAAIHGSALGGGLEIALACHFRCAVSSARFGLPEVKLGLVPGAGGTQRLPRLIGMEPALEMALSGEPADAETALSLGLIDAMLPGELMPGALEFAHRVVAENRPLRAVSSMTTTVPAASDGGYFDAVRKKLEKSASGQLAPFLIAQSVENSVTLPFTDGWRKEEEFFWRCVESPQSKALLLRFFEQRAAPKAL